MKNWSKKLFAILLTLALVLPANLSFTNSAVAGSAKVFNASEIAAGDITEVTQFGDFTVMANAEKKVTVDANNKVTSDGTMSFTQRLKLNGAGDATFRSVSFKADAKAKVVVYAMSGSSSEDRELALLDATGAELARGMAYGVASDGIKPIEYDVEAGTYYLVSTKSSINIYYISVTEEEVVADDSTSSDAVVFNPSEMTAGDILEVTQVGAFTLIASADKLTVDANEKISADGTLSFTQRLKLNGSGAVDKRAVSFIIDADTTMTIYAMSGSSSEDRTLKLYDGTGAWVKDITALGACPDGIPAEKVDLTPGTYYLFSGKSGINIYYISLAPQGAAQQSKERMAWSKVTAPVLSNAVDAGSTLTVDYKMLIGSATDGCDRLYLYLLDENNEVVETANIFLQSEGGKYSFKPKKSGTYSIKAEAARDDEENVIAGNTLENIAYSLPLATPNVKSATSVGNGGIEVVWDSVSEADSYEVAAYEMGSGESKYLSSITTDKLSCTFSNLTVGNRYEFKVAAKRGAETSSTAAIEANATKDAQRVWEFSAFGTGVNTKDNYYEGNANDGKVTVASLNGKGKLVPASTDGVAFYYTKINPETENFKLSAKVHVDEWTFSNGQDGFGLMVCDRVASNGDSSVIWNNSYMATLTKVEWHYDSETGKIQNAGSKVTMKIGIGAQEKIGVTAANIADNSIQTDLVNLFSSTMWPLERSGETAGSGNLVGNATNQDAITGNRTNLLVDFDLSIERNNTGYVLTYTDPEGKVGKKLYYDIERTSLTQIDPENIYVGFFASRNAKITVTDIVLTTSNPATDAPAEEREIETVAPTYEVLSTGFTGSSDYEFIFATNCDGTMLVTNKKGEVVIPETHVNALEYYKQKFVLEPGTTNFNVKFTPDADYKPNGQYSALTDYSTQMITHAVVYKTYEGENGIIYVSPTGTRISKGTKDSPLDILTAVRYVQPGQKIYLQGGIYSMTDTVKVGRGQSGNANNLIYLMADPEATERPVFDFQKLYTGFVFAGDYWYMSGFDVTRSAAYTKGIQISGSHNTLDGVNAYYNGNTGIQISRLAGTDGYADWPSYNTILNCSSYNNADPGYEDADGFACKLTTGDGNVFDGCISYYNADDGWDLYAKLETGAIGSVVIKNCVAFRNGYLSDGTVAGNGNGFKLGGSSISGKHSLINCLAFENKAKGIDSNSCPDIQVMYCTTVNNGSYNVAFYTNDATETAYMATGLLSFRTENTNIGENIKPKGAQAADPAKIYKESDYYWDAAAGVSKNKSEVTVSADWFVSLDTSKLISRNEDGTINLNGVLELSEKAPKDTGARFNMGTKSADFVKVTTSIEPKEAPKATPMPTPTPVPATESNVTPAVEETVEESSSSPAGWIIAIVVILAACAGSFFAIKKFGKKKEDK